jgi:hypothetical protein
MGLFLIFLSAMIVNNILLIRFIALCSFFGISNSMQTSIGMGFAVVFVMIMATTISWLVYHYLLVPFDLLYLRTASFILTIATFVQLEEMVIRKMFRPCTGHGHPTTRSWSTARCWPPPSCIDYNRLVKSLIYTLGWASTICHRDVRRHPGATNAPDFPVLPGLPDRLHHRQPDVAGIPGIQGLFGL